MNDFDPTKPIGLRGDENVKVTILAKDLNHPVYKLVIQYQDKSGQDNVGLRLRNGHMWAGGTESEYDLVNVPEERTCVVVFYTNGTHSLVDPRNIPTGDHVWDVVHVTARKGESKYDLVNVPSRIPFWIIKSASRFGMYTTACPSEHATAKWRGPFYMAENGNPVSGDE